jgi:hypothetical protein
MREDGRCWNATAQEFRYSRKAALGVHSCGQVCFKTVPVVIVISPNPLFHITADTFLVFIDVHLDVNCGLLSGSRG